MKTLWKAFTRALRRLSPNSTIVIVTPNGKVPCKHCFEEIDPRAKVCPKCRVHQKPIVGLLLTYVPGALALIAFFSLLFAGLQVYETRQKRIEAQEALGKAAGAQENAEAALKQVDSIVKRIEGQAVTVDSVAKQAADAKRISEEVQEKNQQADEKLKAIDEALKRGNEAVAELQAYATFNKTVLAAQNDDRRAFDQLATWGEDKKYPFAEAAQQTWISILDAHPLAGVFQSGFIVPWDEGVDPTKLSLEQLRAAYQAAPSHVRLGIVEYSWEKRRDLPKHDRMQFLVDVLRNDSSLNVVALAGRYFSGESKTLIKPLAVKQHVEWWEKNKDSIQQFVTKNPNGIPSLSPEGCEE